MTTIRLLQSRSKRGFALVLILVGIATASLLLSGYLKYADELKRLVVTRWQIHKLESQAREDFSGLKTHLVELLSRAIAIRTTRQAGAQVLGGTLSYISANDLSSQFDQVILNQLTDNDPSNDDFIPSFLYESFPTYEGSLNYTLSPLGSADLSNTFPKLFNVTIRRSDPNAEATVFAQGLLSFQKAALSKFSYLALNVTGDEVWFGNTNQAQIGVFFDSNSAGIIRFVNSEPLFAEKIISNTALEKIMFGYQGPAQWDGTTPTLTSAGVNLSRGIETAAAAGVDLLANFSEQLPSANPATIWSERDSSEISSCSIRLGNCVADRCQIQMVEGLAGGGSVTVFDGIPTPNSVLYSRAPTGCEVTSIDPGASQAYIGRDNVLFMADQGFTAKKSIVLHPSAKSSIENSDIPSNQGAVIFVGLEDAGMKLAHDAAVLTGGTLTELHQRVNQVDENTETFRLDVGMVSASLEKPAYQVDSSLLTSFGTGSHLGKLSTDGPSYGGIASVTSSFDLQTATRIAGFSKLNSVYSSRWQKSDLPGFGGSSRSNLDHVVYEVSYVVRTENLNEALQSVGLSWEE